MYYFSQPIKTSKIVKNGDNDTIGKQTKVGI